MPRVDPRERYDDLVVTESREVLPPAEFADAAWFDGLPDDLFHPELTTTASQRCLDGADPT